MEFSIRALSLVPSIPVDARTAVGELLSAQIEFRTGIPYSIILPGDHERFGALGEPERTLTALNAWGRVYRYPHGDAELLHILAPVDGEDGDLKFYRLDLRQPPKPRRGVRPPVEFICDSTMSHDECATWLITLALQWAAHPDQRQRQIALSRPCPIKLDRVRLGWVGPEVVETAECSKRLIAIGKVYDAEIIHVIPRGFRDISSRLSGAMPLNAIVICRHFAPYATDGTIPTGISRDLVHYCDSTTLDGLVQQVKTWIEITRQEGERLRAETAPDESTLLLTTILRAMISHSKIGPFNHCQKETVLLSVRARRMNVPAAERILDANSEGHQDTKESDTLFLWKEHNDGRRYFLNPRRVEDIKVMIITR